MKHLIAFAVMLIVCTASALARDDRPVTGCEDPLTTGSLPAETHSTVARHRVWETPPEESWQELADEDAERRRREQAEGCPVD